ncbi:hypothetical protein BGW39_000115 [Mortierella sp. 14UC]|nr:hypothetical protein BGW39_000115 [Mortierella sp. 14UC]
MKFIAATLLISAALAAVASAAPLANNIDILNAASVKHNIVKRCGDSTYNDGLALDIIVKASADHYSTIAHARLDNLMSEIETAKVTSGAQDLPQEKAALSIAVQTKIDEAKKAYSPEVLAPAIKATVTADANLDIPWSKKEIEKKMAELDAKITQLTLKRIQASISAELLSKDCTEMTNTEVAPAPAPAPAPVDAPAPAPSPIEAPAPAPATPAAAEPYTSCTSTTGGVQAAPTPSASADSKFVCKIGCKDSNDAKDVLTLRVNLESELTPRLDHFYQQVVPTACTENRETLLGGVLNLIANLNVSAQAEVKN